MSGPYRLNAADALALLVAGGYGGLGQDSVVTGQWTFTDSLVLNNQPGYGIQVNPNEPAWTWRDIEGTPQEPATPVGRPSWSQIASSGVYCWSYAVNDTQTYFFHVPHDIALDPDTGDPLGIFFHVHWFGSQTAGNSTKWRFNYLYSKGHQQGAFPTTATSVYVQQAQNTTAYTHMIAESDEVDITGLEVDGLILVQATRIAPDAPASDVSGSVFVPMIDLHYRSTNIGTLYKSPNFYTNAIGYASPASGTLRIAGKAPTVAT